MNLVVLLKPFKIVSKKQKKRYCLKNECEYDNISNNDDSKNSDRDDRDDSDNNNTINSSKENIILKSLCDSFKFARDSLEQDLKLSEKKCDLLVKEKDKLLSEINVRGVQLNLRGLELKKIRHENTCYKIKLDQLNEKFNW